MYESFYGLKEKPFSMLPDPGFLYLSKKHQKALTLFEYGLMNHAGFCVISGEIGSGKTTLLRKLLENMNRKIVVGMITNTHKGFGDLLDWVLSAFDIHERGLNEVEKHQRFMDFLVEQYAAKKTTLLIVDEAQNMAADKLEELRMLSNINSGKDQVLQIILAGQPELKDTLRLPELMQFVQRISVDYHLDSLDQEDTRGYIKHRLSVSGADKAIFTDDACDMIYKYSGGTPRLINLLCDTAMVYGFADQQAEIDDDIVAEMILERMQDSLVPLASSEPPKKKARKNITAHNQTDNSDGNVDSSENDFGEKVMQAVASDLEDVPVNDISPEVEIDAADSQAHEKEIQVDSSPDDFSEETTSVSEESVNESIDFSQLRKSEKTALFQPLLVGLLVLVFVTLFFALTLEEQDAELVDSETGNRQDKTTAAVIEAESTDLERHEKQKAVPTIPDGVTKQLDDARKIQGEMALQQQKSSARLKALEEQTLLLKKERDNALKKAKHEKEKRAAEAEAARIAAQREVEAQKVAQEAIAEAMVSENKAKILEALRAKEIQSREELARKKLESEVLIEEQQENVELIETSEPDRLEIVDEKKATNKDDVRCQGATARFLSICR